MISFRCAMFVNIKEAPAENVVAVVVEERTFQARLNSSHIYDM